MENKNIQYVDFHKLSYDGFVQWFIAESFGRYVKNNNINLNDEKKRYSWFIGTIAYRVSY